MAWDTFYGNEANKAALQQRLRLGRVSHGYLFYGETGLGKKTFARQFGAALLCQGTGEKPCGQCKSCRMLQKQTHPDAIFVEHSGKRGGFSVETVRQICTDLYTPPNEGDRKCYFFMDCDAMDVRTQNLLLKAIEEPPDYAYFFFTAQSPTALLPTVRSRITAMALQPVSESICQMALLEQGYTPEACAEAMQAFPGNLGACRTFLENEKIQDTVRLTKIAIHSIIKKEEYAFLQASSTVATDRTQTMLFLTLLDRTLRDAVARKQDPHAVLIGCDAKGADTLAQRLTLAAGQKMHLAVDKAYDALQANVNIQLTLAALCAVCMDA